MGRVMMNIRRRRGDVPTLDSVRERYGLAASEIDARFGVIAVDRERQIYTVLVDEPAVPKFRADADWDVEGPFSNPRITAV